MNDVDSKTDQAVAMNARRHTSETLLLALFLLFFVQLATVWIESIYRLSLIKLSMGREMLGLLLPLLALVQLLFGRKSDRMVFVMAAMGLLATRALCPFLSAPWLIVNAGAGVGAFLVVLCHVLARRAGGADFAVAAGLGVLMSTTIRAWGSSLDFTMEFPGAWIGWGLVGLAAALLCVMRPVVSESDTRPAERRRFDEMGMLAMALFANLSLVYLLLSNPMVVSAWAGASHQLVLAMLAASMSAVIARQAWGMPLPFPKTHRGLFVWNLVFVLCLAWSITLNTVAFPVSPDSAAVFVAPAPWHRLVPLYSALALSSVIPFNILALTKQMDVTRPRALVLPVLLGMGLFLFVVVLLIATNTWGYMGALAAELRNVFYAPFVIAGLAAMSPFLRPMQNITVPQSGPARSKALAALVLALGLAAISGVALRTSRPLAAGSDARRLTVLTYNMQQGSAPNADQSYRAQLEFIRSVNADIIGLQESDTGRPSGGNVYAARYFADGLGYYLYDGPNTISGTFGTAILSRYPLSNCRTFFTYSMVDEVGTAVADFEVGGRAIAFFNSHPAGNSDVHAAHVDALLEEAARFDHVIAVGDYNFRQDSPHYARVAAGLTDSWRSLYPDAVGRPCRREEQGLPLGEALDMTDRIDHIFVSPAFRVVESCYVPPPASRTDHPAHWTILEWD